ncbi:AHL_G0027210.mRNA.1.CDS.1 [Saccharomyces cerevisiae]|nr:Mnt3p [Saccharomyces cerevisiae YJM1078]AJR37470.1 Mnt3p [Saccharomyces cerevisiae YJM248]AJR45284.1 Mnt3p [Saccharomyces cerevisiae YJM1252]CAI4391387.1 CPG_1a_G0027230.mRNA.1.CDS.1 [Saccharomyces cerevisiae]CAI4402374.1 AIE_G0027230.mRNA.1.CDS.1 [Saccharomyces cerevisiae]
MLKSLKSRRLILKRSITLLLSLLFSYLIFSASRNATSSNKLNSHASERTAVESSAFGWIEKRQRQMESENLIKRLFAFFLPSLSTTPYNERVLLTQLAKNEIAKRDKCRYIFEVLYRIDRNWDNAQTAKFYNVDGIDNTLASLLGERLRSYDYCFLSGELDPTEVFDNSSINPHDLQNRIFPFLKKTNNESKMVMWPVITDLTTGEAVPIPNVDMESSKFNGNFWFNWNRLSKGRGFVLTIAEKDVPLFLKQLKVMEFSKNELPFQIVTTGNELSAESIAKISEVANETKQKVYLIDCSTVLDTEFSKTYISFFQNKWVATLFNTFEEYILLDADVVPFVGSDYFFDSPSYKESGILLFKDRVMENEQTFQYCIEMLSGVEPSGQERRFIGSNLIFDSSLPFSSETSEEASVYYNFFKKLRLHHVDSGLVVVNKLEKLNGLLMSFMLNLDGKLQRCVYGDKEIFWLGQLYAGQDYSINPVDGSIIGPVNEQSGNDNGYTSGNYYICSTQIAHSDSKNKLLWVNGGLKTCKIPNSAEDDFGKEPEYFKSRYEDVSELKRLYDAPLNVEGLIVPDVSVHPWMQIKECSNYMYCAYSTDDIHTNSEPDAGRLITFTEKELRYINDISRTWNAN